MDSKKDATENLGSSVGYPPIGTRVIVVDGSDAHGDEGVVWDISNGVCLIGLDQGCIWAVSETREVKLLCG